MRIHIELGGNGHKPPDSFSFRSSFRFRSSSCSSSTTSGDIFYCSGSRQLFLKCYGEKVRSCSDVKCYDMSKLIALIPPVAAVAPCRLYA